MLKKGKKEQQILSADYLEFIYLKLEEKKLHSN